MRKLFSFCVVTLLTTVLSCNVIQEEQLQPVNDPNSKPFTAASVTTIDQTNSLLQKLQTKAEMKSFEESNGTLNLNEVTLTIFNETNDYELILIPLIEKGKTLISVHRKANDTFFIGLYERAGTENNRGEFTGINYLKKSDGTIVIAEKVNKNASNGSARGMVVITPILTPIGGSGPVIGGGGGGVGPNSGACYDCINRNYQKMKATCEADALCDITCSLSPCFALWAATALANCSSGCCTGNPCNPFS